MRYSTPLESATDSEAAANPSELRGARCADEAASSWAHDALLLAIGCAGGMLVSVAAAICSLRSSGVQMSAASLVGLALPSSPPRRAQSLRQSVEW